MRKERDSVTGPSYTQHSYLISLAQDVLWIHATTLTFLSQCKTVTTGMSTVDILVVLMKGHDRLL